MTPELRGLAAQQGGVFSRRQAAHAGCSERELKTRTGVNGDWHVVCRGVYAERDLWTSLDDDGQYRIRVCAALLAGVRDAVASHSSAAILHDMPIRPRWRRLVHVTRPDVRGGRTEGGVAHHPARCGDTDIVTVEGVRVTALARTAVDVGRQFGFEDGVIAADAALRLGADRADLDRVVADMRNWPGITSARSAVRYADPGAENIAESLLRLLVIELGQGVPETQFPVVDRGRQAFVDLRLRRHLIEFDGMVKYHRRDAGGVADRPAEQVVVAEKSREDWLRGLGYGMSRVTWSELFGPARELTRQRLARDIRQSDRRFGTFAA